MSTPHEDPTIYGDQQEHERRVTGENQPPFRNLTFTVKRILITPYES